MATVEFKPYTGGQIHAERTNEYITNGHGDEVLVRTNRYLNDGHGLNNGCVGVNCPSDPALATELMEQLRVRYENNLGARNTKGTNSDKTPVAHYQFFVSWHTDESVPPAERYEMGRELISRTKLKEHANLMAAHNNTDEDHLHISTSAFSLDGTHKLCVNNSLLYELRREMDRICVERGYSIVESPELWGDKEYKEWFECVKDLDVVTVHPPLPRKKRTQKQQYADAKKAEREERERRFAELETAKKMTPKNRGTNFYGLPHVYDPLHPDRQLYIYALDKKGNRRSPLQLDFALQVIWAKRCTDKLNTMQDFPGKEKFKTRFGWIWDNAFDALDFVDHLDIGTRTELESHLKAVGGDIAKYKQEVALQEKIITTAQEQADTAKLERATARKDHAEKMLTERNDEYRRLKRAESILDGMDTGEHWEEFKTELMKRSTSRLRVTERREKTIRDNYHDIGQIMGIPQEEIDRIIADAKAATMDSIEAMWTVRIDGVRITYTQRKSGLSALYDHVGEMYAERRKHRSALYEFRRDFPIVGPVTALLFLALAIPLAISEANQEKALDLRIAYARRVAEEIRWHNKNCEEQLKQAKRMLAVKLACYDGAEADRAWFDFYKECDKMMQRARELKAIEADLAGDRMTHSSVLDMESEITAAKELRKPTLDDTITAAGQRSSLTSRGKENEQTR